MSTNNTSTDAAPGATPAVDTPSSTDLASGGSDSAVRISLGRILSGTGGPLIGLVLLVLILSFAAPNFASMRNALNIIDQVTVTGLMALGATAVIVTGGIDLSVGSILALSTMTLGWLSHYGPRSMFLGIMAALAIGLVTGLINGLAITRANLPPFIATLAMMSIARGLANLTTDGNQIVQYPQWFFELSSKRYFGFLSVNTAVLIVLCVVAGIVMARTATGRALYAIGGNSEVARLAGIRVKAIITGAYGALGLLSGLAGIVMATRLDSSQPSAGTGYEMDVIAAVVIGGASLAGGSGRILGTIVGVLIMGVLRNGLNLLGVSPFWQSVIIGLVIALAVMTDTLKRKS
ncbi:MAG: ABC transporter permease [Actinomycetaceae bacterium]|nr:ABC transporter permease [Actinomycetaceae bacterium]